MRLPQLKAAPMVTAAMIVLSGCVAGVLNGDRDAVTAAAAQSGADISPTETVQRFLDARNANDRSARIALLVTGSRFLIPNTPQTTSKTSRPTDFVALGYSEAGAAVIAFLDDPQNEAGYGFKVLGVDQANPSVVKLEVTQPAERPSLVLNIITVKEGAQVRIDAMATATHADPLVARVQRAMQERGICSKNLKMIMIAMFKYLQKHDDQYPDADHWMDELSKYLPDKSVFHDPSDTSGHRYSYAFNRALSRTKMVYLLSPADTVCIFESTSGKRNASDMGKSLPRSERHLSGLLYAFADGHVKLSGLARIPKINSSQ